MSRMEGGCPSLAGSSAMGPLDLEDALLDVAGDVNRPASIAEVTLELAEDGGDGKGRERRSTSRVESIDRLDKGHARHLDEIVERLGAAGVASRQPRAPAA